MLHLFGVDAQEHLAWAATTALLLVRLAMSVTRTLLGRDVGVDAIALVSMDCAGDRARVTLSPLGNPCRHKHAK